MKKSIVFVLFALVLLSGFVLAANDTGAINPANLGNEAKAVVSGAGNEVSGVLEKDVEIPANLQSVFRVLFGLKEGEKVVLNVLIIMFALLIILFLMIMGIMSIVPFFGGWKSLVGAILVTLLVAVSGGINKSAIFFAGLGSGVEFLGRYPILRLITSLIILGLILLGTNKLSTLIKNKLELDAARTTGARVKEGSESAQVLSKGVSQLGGPTG